MKSYIDLLNEKLGSLLIDLNRTELDQQKRTIDIETKRKIETITDYYRTVIKGAIQFSNDVIYYKDITVNGISLNENPDICIDRGIELDENPPINIDLKTVTGVRYNNKTIFTKKDKNGIIRDIILEDNPPIDLDLKGVQTISVDNLEKTPTINLKSNGDIELDENPPIDIKLKKVKDISIDDKTILLDENPPIDIELSGVQPIDVEGKDILLSENPPIDIQLKGVKKVEINEKDIFLDENPSIDIKLKNVKKIDSFNNDKKSPLSAEALGIDLKEVSNFSFDSEEVKRSIAKKRKEILEKRKKSNKKGQ